MTQQKNYTLLSTVATLALTTYNDISVKFGEKFKVHPDQKDHLKELLENIGYKATVKRLNDLGIIPDERNLNLPHMEFIGKDSRLKHLAISLGNSPLNSGLFVRPQDNTELLKETKTNVSATINTVLNTINPLVKKITNEYMAKAETIVGKEEDAGYVVKRIDMPDFVNTMKDEMSLDVDPKLNINFDYSFTTASYEDFMPNGKDAISNDMRDFINSVSAKELQDIWDKYMGHASLYNSVWENLYQHIETRRDVYILTALIYHMTDNKVNTTSSMVSWNDSVKVMLNYLKNCLSFILASHTESILNDKLITSVIGKDIYVNEIVLAKALTKGITIDTIFGAVLAKEPYSNLETFVVNKTHWTDSWLQYKRQNMVINENMIEAAKVDVLRMVITNNVNDVDTNILESVLKNITEQDVQSIEATVIDIISNLYNDDDNMLVAFYTYLRQIKQSNEGLDINFYAAIVCYQIIMYIYLAKVTK